MGAQLSTVAPTATVPIDAYIAELGDLTYSTDLGRSRFLKTVRAVHRDGVAVVKVFMKPTTAQIDISHAKEQLRDISDRLRYTHGGDLNEFPNAIGYSRIIETDRAGYLVRQFIKHSLYDRISTRPFLEPIEKKWIAFQLLKGLEKLHEHNIFHGDIKSENVLVGSWKWVYIVDFAPFKPVRLPETDSAQFLFYFDVSKRRACYVAPERFGNSGPAELNAGFDIYSAGCVIAELFLDGQPLFSLADLFKYKRGEYTPDLSNIEDVQVRELILSMVSVNASDRLGAREYLAKCRGTIFPKYFDTYWELLVPFSGSGGATNSDKMVKHMWNRFETDVLESSLGCKVKPMDGESLPKTPLPAVVSLPHTWWIPRKLSDSDIPAESGALIILSYVCSALKSTSTTYWRLRTAEMILALAEFVPDDAKLDRCLPYLLYLTRDTQQSVKATALAYITHLLSMVSVYSPLNSKLFSAYLFPRLTQAVNANSSAEVRAVYAACFPSLAKFAVQCEGWSSVANFIDESTRLLLVDKVGIVRRSFLRSAESLCMVLRKQGTNDVILSHAITYLNDKDPLVRMDLFRLIARISPLVGPASIEQYVVPLMIQSLCDRREDIVALVVESLASMVDIGLLRLKLLLGTVVSNCAKFLIHPNIYIRTQTLLLIAAAARQLSKAQVYCLLRPIIAPYLSSEVDDYGNHRALIEALRPPFPQAVYSLAFTWITQAQNSSFWNPSARSSNSTVTFSQEDSRWLSRLREVGFNNEDLWQLLSFREYLWQLSLSPPIAPPPSELEAEEPDSLAPLSDASNISGDEKKKATPITWKGGHVPQDAGAYIKAHDVDKAKLSSTLIIASKPAGRPLKTNVAPGKYEGLSGTTTPTGRHNPGTFADPSSVHKPSVLVTSIKTHRGAIRVLTTHPNNRLFVTGADDGLVKLWDAGVLLKGSSRPVLVWNADSPVTACTFLGESSVLIVATENGEIKFLDIVFKVLETGAFSIESFRPIADYQLKSGYGVALHHPQSNDVTEAVADLWVLQSTCQLLQIHLPDMSEAKAMQSPPEHGIPTSWAWDHDGDWVVVGTSHGMLHLFDTRFSLRVQSWGVGDLQPISALEIHPMKPKWVCIAGGFTRNLISVWDIQKLECKELLVPRSDLEAEDEEILPSLNPIPESQQTLTEKFAGWNISDTFSRLRPPVTAISASSRLGGHHLLSGGGDCILRYWNLIAAHQSAVVSGLEFAHCKVSYMGKVGSNTRFTYETMARHRNSERLARTAVIGNEERDIGRNHRGTITNVRLMKSLQGDNDLAISVDEVGVLKLFA